MEVGGYSVERLAPANERGLVFLAAFYNGKLGTKADVTNKRNSVKAITVLFNFLQKRNYKLTSFILHALNSLLQVFNLFFG